jgi:hypothetical protein
VPAAPLRSVPDAPGWPPPAGTIFKELGFTAENVADVARRVVHEGFSGVVIPTPAGGGHPGASGTDRSGAAGTDPGHS